MAFNLEEQEKIENAKALWARFGNLLSALALIVLLVVAGWYGWQWYKDHQLGKALGYYEVAFETAQSQSDDSLKRMEQAVRKLQDDYAATPFTPRATLLLAKRQADAGHYDQAAENLKWLSNRSGDGAEFQAAAKLQLASVLASAQKFDEALNTLSNPPEGYQALFQDRKADVLYAKGDQQGAQKIWAELLKLDNELPAFAQSIKYKSSLLTNTGK